VEKVVIKLLVSKKEKTSLIVVLDDFSARKNSRTSVANIEVQLRTWNLGHN
jgi:hypothetical protein